MGTEVDQQRFKPSVELLTGFKWDARYDSVSRDLTPADVVPESNVKHLFAATARLSGKGVCKAWVIKPELINLDDYAFFGFGPGDPKDLMRKVFDWQRPPSSRDAQDTFNKGVKFLQQFDTDYDYLEEELDDIRNRAWIVFFRTVHVDERYRRQGVGTALVRALVQEVLQLSQLEGRPVLAFTKLEKAILSQSETTPITTQSPTPESPSPKKREKQLQEARIQASFWQSLAFERLNDGHLFAKDLDWLVWSPRARNAALLFERAEAFPVDFDALIEGQLDEDE